METREMPAQPSPLVRELDHRSSGGVDVRLLLSDRDGRVIVAVHDSRTDDAFTVQVLPHDSAARSSTVRSYTRPRSASRRATSRPR
jgi:hypothetical protein